MALMTPVTESGCWVWLGALSQGGYAQIHYNGKTSTAHRLIYEYYNGPVSRELQLDHLCRVRCCVNPRHLEVVTRLENVRRGEGGRHNAIKTHCPYGHEYTSENTCLIPRCGGRYLLRECRICKRRRQTEFEQRRAAGLLMIGSAVVGDYKDLTVPQQEVVHSILNPKVKKSKKAA